MLIMKGFSEKPSCSKYLFQFFEGTYRCLKLATKMALFVCYGSISRSVMAEGFLKKIVENPKKIMGL